MTVTPTNPAPPAPGPTADRSGQLNAALEQVHEIATALTPDGRAELGGAQRTLDEITRRWAATARARHREAAGSAADRAQWEALIAAATSPPGQQKALRPEDIARRALRTRDLLQAIASSTPPAPPVAGIAARIQQAITDGVYVPGSVLAYRKMARDLDEQPERVRLALSDLVAAGVAEVRGPRTYVTRPAGHHERFVQYVADQIAGQISAGLYPSGTRLPAQHDLARCLATTYRTVCEIERALAADGWIHKCKGGQSPVVANPLPSTVTVAAPRGGPKTSAALRGPVPDLARVPSLARRMRAWRRCHSSPPRDTLDQHIAELQEALRYLLPRAEAAAGTTRPKATVVQRRRTWRLAHAWWLQSVIPREDTGLRVWHGTCLGNAAEDLLRAQDAG
ncbi:hypothetical protein AB0H73_09865 [Streptomyces olivoreticuli]